MKLILKERKKKEEDINIWLGRCERLIGEKCKYDEAIDNGLKAATLYFNKGILVASLSPDEMTIWEEENEGVDEGGVEDVKSGESDGNKEQEVE